MCHRCTIRVLIWFLSQLALIRYLIGCNYEEIDCYYPVEKVRSEYKRGSNHNKRSFNWVQTFLHFFFVLVLSPPLDIGKRLWQKNLMDYTKLILRNWFRCLPGNMLLAANGSIKSKPKQMDPLHDKACLVAKVSWINIYSLSKMASVRTLIFVYWLLRLLVTGHCIVWTIKIAFLNVFLFDKVYLHPPPSSPHLFRHVCRLQCMLYGSKQDLRASFDHFHATVRNFGY